jgi:hypothetical protein
VKKLLLPLGKEHRIVRWANSIRAFYGHPVYLVGSQCNPDCKNPRDVDIVCYIPDYEFDLRYGNHDKWCDENCTGIYTDIVWSWADDCLKKSLSGMRETGYVIDFKVYFSHHKIGYANYPKIKLDTRGIF